MQAVFTIDGNKTLEEITGIITFQESKNCEFTGNVILDGEPLANKPGFLYDDGSAVPNPLVLRKTAGTPKGCLKKPFWSGPMAVEGERIEVFAFRSKKKNAQ